MGDLLQPWLALAALGGAGGWNLAFPCGVSGWVGPYWLLHLDDARGEGPPWLPAALAARPVGWGREVAALPAEAVAVITGH